MVNLIYLEKIFEVGGYSLQQRLSLNETDWFGKECHQGHSLARATDYQTFFDAFTWRDTEGYFKQASLKPNNICKVCITCKLATVAELVNQVVTNMENHYTLSLSGSISKPSHYLFSENIWWILCAFLSFDNSCWSRQRQYTSLYLPVTLTLLCSTPAAPQALITKFLSVHQFVYDLPMFQQLLNHMI